MPVEPSLLVWADSERIWLESESLISYLRFMESQAEQTCNNARIEFDNNKAIASYASKDVICQIADGLVLTSMTTAEEFRSKRESKR
tara:strand:+ start:280 stop:540 length:261 start_codon:yes stop_codon:yes gene_type:complete